MKKLLIYSERGVLNMNDEQIITLYWKRSEKAIKETSKKYGKKLKAVSMNIVQSIPTAEECENDTYLEAWNSMPPHEPHNYLFAFLARIIRHISLNRCKEQNTLKRNAFVCELSAELEECIPSPDDDINAKIDEITLKNVINYFLSSLTEEKRRIFLRRYWYMDSIKDIAKRFSISESNAKTTLFRIREQMKEYLVKEGYDI